MKLVLLEAYCLKDLEKNVNKKKPDFCTLKEDERGQPSYRCFFNDCPCLDYTYCDNMICRVNEHAEVDYGVFFDTNLSDKQQQKLREIAVRKIDEAYEEFMEYLNNIG